MDWTFEGGASDIETSYVYVEGCVLDVVREVRAMQHGVGSTNKIMRALRHLHTILDKSPMSNVIAIVDVHRSEVLRARFALKEAARDSPALRSLYDRVFEKQLGLVGQVPRAITLLFEDFVKGITYFSWQHDPGNPRPVYHRLEACGPGTDVFRKAHQRCTAGVDRRDILRLRKLVERCYVERLIYDALWRTQTPEGEQDSKHAHRLGLTRDDYRSCFPDRDVRAHVADGAEGVPCTLTLEFYHKDRLVAEETYEKTVSIAAYGARTYDTTVLCTRHTPTKFYKKAQSYQCESDWQQVQPNRYIEVTDLS